MTIASERYLAVCQPFKHNNFTKSRVTMVFILIYLMGVVCTAGAAFQVFVLQHYKTSLSTSELKTLLLTAYEVWGKILFSQACVILSTRRVDSQTHLVTPPVHTNPWTHHPPGHTTPRSTPVNKPPPQYTQQGNAVNLRSVHILLECILVVIILTSLVYRRT